MSEEELKQMSGDELIGIIKAQRFEIKEKDLIIQELRDTIDNQREEIDRLNNIINGLEKYLIEHIDEYRDMEQDAMFEFGLVLDKLKELKNGDNNE